MNLALEIGAQRVTHEIIGRGGESLTGAQAQLSIDLVYQSLSRGQEDALSGTPTLAQKANWILGRMSNQYLQVAAQELRRQKQAGVEQEILSELG